jgi:hypothetical protein
MGSRQRQDELVFPVHAGRHIASGPSPASQSKLILTPELKEQRNATVLYVFGL